jgi:hypothetical protein
MPARANALVLFFGSTFLPRLALDIACAACVEGVPTAYVKGDVYCAPISSPTFQLLPHNIIVSFLQHPELQHLRFGRVQHIPSPAFSIILQLRQ